MADRYNDLIIDLRYSAKHAQINDWMMLFDAADAIKSLNEKYQKALADIVRLSPPGADLHRCDGCDYFDIVWFKCKKHGNRHISEVKCKRKTP